MKKILFGLVLTLITSVSAFATGNTTNTNEKVLKAFKAQFSTAVNVSWSEMPDLGLYHAAFTRDDQRLDAFYNEEGELVATGRNVETKLLAPEISQKIAQYYPEGKVDGQMLECNIQGFTSYYVTVRTAKASFILKADTDGTVSVFKKQRIEI